MISVGSTGIILANNGNVWISAVLRNVSNSDYQNSKENSKLTPATIREACILRNILHVFKT